MSKFIFKQIYRLFPYALFFICLIFLFCNHLDTLASEIPAQAEIYFHANAKDIQQIPREQKDIILNWLEKGSTVSRDSWQELFNASADEIGIFTLNKQIFGITKNNPAVISILQNRNIEFSLNENALYFPSLNVADKKISTEPWYMESKRKINFAKYNLFLKNSSAIAILQSFSEINTTKPVSAFGKLENNHLIFNIYGNVGQEKLKSSEPHVISLGNTANFYFRGILPETIAQNADYSEENIKFLLIKSLKGSIEYLDMSDRFIIYADKQNNSMESIEKSILTIFAFLDPTEKIKLLPDETESIQLIADPSRWQFSNVGNTEQQVRRLDNIRPNTTFSIHEKDNFYIIAKNIDSADISLFEVGANEPAKIGGCHLNTKQINAFVNGKIWQDSFFHNLVVSNERADRLSVCID